MSTISNLVWWLFFVMRCATVSVGLLYCFWETLSYSKSLTWQATAANVHTRSWSKYTAICCPVGNYQWLLWSHSTNVRWLVVATFCGQKVFSWAFCWYHRSCSMCVSQDETSSASEAASIQLTPPDLLLHSSSVASSLESMACPLSSSRRFSLEKIKGIEGGWFSSPWLISFWWVTLFLSPMHLFQI